MEITPAQMKEFLKGSGANQIEGEVTEEFAEVLENYIGYITEEAVGLSEESGKVTVTQEDIAEAEM